jgi:hypothetical protein
MLCSLCNGVRGQCVLIRDQCIACARSNSWMHMHTYHGGYPTISHICVGMYEHVYMCLLTFGKN